ncbi:MAG: PhnD/SsuA/transferrin family substrate-binding protein [Defluviicoccus sp.]|nr:PhnD/SsuA/transferrin family substrate-binding protein [Defluviicoccus sp.]MDE0386666.1 PhnD/SsuA/transferrin family substrate-binding protein [Defluviicoccus sp.]
MRLASLPMYDLPEIRRATRAWWAGLARAFAAAGLDDVPQILTAPGDRSGHWRDRRLLISQACGRNYVRELAGHVRLVATPCYAAPGCDGPLYSSLLLAGADSDPKPTADMSRARVAINGFDSHSGWVALCAAVSAAGAAPDFADIRVTGTHAASMAAVRRGEADLCAVDCVTFALLERHAPQRVAGLKFMGRTPAAPGLPYITSAGTGPGELSRLRDGLSRALEAPDLASVRDSLFIERCEVLADSAYDRVRDMAREIDRAGGPGAGS